MNSKFLTTQFSNSIHIAVSLLFFAFAYVQWNDPDPYAWILLYAIVGLIPILYLKEWINRKALRIFIITIVCAFLIYLPSIVQWFGNGMPSIVGSMKAEESHIELIRESLGLLLSCMTAIYYYRKNEQRL